MGEEAGAPAETPAAGGARPQPAPEAPAPPAPEMRERLAPVVGRKIRVLALHGGGSNSNVMRYQTGQLQVRLKKYAEWVFLDGKGKAPSRPPPEVMLKLAGDIPLGGWYDAQIEGEAADDGRSFQEKIADPEVKFRYDYVDENVEDVLRAIRERGPFDVALGFSQGCIVMHLVCAMLRERGEAVPWRLSLLFCGMPVRDHRFGSLFEEPLRVPSVMVFGKEDEFYDYSKDRQVKLYQDPLVLEHDEGHKFPGKQPRAKEIYDVVVQQILEHCGQQADE